MKNKKIIMCVTGALCTMAGTVLTFLSEVVFDAEKKNNENKKDEEA